MNIRQFILLGMASVLLSFNAIVSAQQNQGFNYQAVARTASGELLKETEISVKISILDPTEHAVWIENHTLSTNDQGLFNIPVGTKPGAVTSQDVESLGQLKWSSEAYSLNIEVNGDDMGLNPILAVPMAFYGRDEDADPENEIQDLSFAGGNLTITNNSAATTIDLGTYVADQNAWQKNANNALLPSGSVGVGTASPEGVLDVVGSTPGDDPIFQVKNTDGVPVLAVYNEGVRILFPDDVSLAKGVKGGFAVGGYNSAKSSETNRFMEVLPGYSKINFFADNNTGTGTNGGFQVGGWNSDKTEIYSFIYMDKYAEPITNDGGYIIILPLFDALNEKGNCYIGTLAGQNREGHFNASIGYQSGYSINANSFFNGTFFTTNTASYNAMVGAFSGYSNDYGDRNVYMGYQSGYLNTGSGNVFIGYQSGAGYTASSNLLVIDNEETTSPLLYGDFNTDFLEVNGSFQVDNGTLRLADNPGSTPTYYVYQGAAGSTSKTLGFTVNDFLWVTRGAEFDGNILVNATTYSSDERYKKDITEIGNGLELVNQLDGVYYNWKTEEFNTKGFEGKRQLGLIAQDVETVIPEVVHTAEDGYKSIDYAKLTAVLIEAVKEQQELIEQQQGEIDALKTASHLSDKDVSKELKEMESTIDALMKRIESMERFAEK